jgi:hypothetical protein
VDLIKQNQNYLGGSMFLLVCGSMLITIACYVLIKHKLNSKNNQCSNLDEKINELKQKFIKKILNSQTLHDVKPIGRSFCFKDTDQKLKHLNFELRCYFHSDEAELVISEFACDYIYLPLEKEEYNQLKSKLIAVYNNNLEYQKEEKRLSAMKTLTLAVDN